MISSIRSEYSCGERNTRPHTPQVSHHTHTPSQPPHTHTPQVSHHTHTPSQPPHTHTPSQPPHTHPKSATTHTPQVSHQRPCLGVTGVARHEHSPPGAPASAQHRV
eukprot:1187851-Prorocentrum_minimum.AAC.4